MTVSDNSNFSVDNCVSIEIYTENNKKGKRKGDCKGRKFAIWFGFVVVFLVSMFVVFGSDMTASSKSYKSTKSKRFVKLDKSEFIQKIITDVIIIPEKEVSRDGNRRTGQHPNHRYTEMESEDKIYKKIMEKVYNENGWSPKPLEVIPEKILNEFHHFTKNKDKEEKPVEKLKSFGSPVRLIGVYRQPETKENPVKAQNKEFTDNYYYLQEINKLMVNDSTDVRGESDEAVKNSVKSHGLPFQLPTKVGETLKPHQEISSKTKDSWTDFESKGNQRKPITLLLDIYPMTYPSDDDINEEPEAKPWHKRRPQNKYNLPLGGHRHSIYDSNIKSTTNLPVRVHQTEGKINRMLMKLNLFPTKKNKSRGFHIDRETNYPRGKRRFGIFYKTEKK